MKTAVIILFHGSRAAGSTEAAYAVAENVRKRGRYEIVMIAFLQHGQPGLLDAIRDCAAYDVKKISIVPFFLQLGMHVTKDIPVLLNEARKRCPDLQIEVTQAIGAHPLVADIVVDLVENELRQR